jgi:hypothetical protein
MIFWLVTLPVRLVLGTAKVSAKAGFRAGRLVGYRRLVVFGAGVATGLLLAPVTGRELRGAIRRRIEARGITDVELAERVRFELSHHPRTWHLPQPTVSVTDRRVSLHGSVPDDAARAEIVRVVGALAGVAAVDDRLEVAGAAAG